MALNGFDHRIRWSEFKQRKERPSNTKEDAEIYIDGSNFTPIIIQKKGIYKVKSISASIKVDNSKSWVVVSKKTPELLKHEQGHFDITALGTRELYNRIKILTADSKRNWNRKAKEINQSIQNKIDSYNLRYDRQTKHGTINSSQRKWNNSLKMEKQKSNGLIDNLPT